MNIYDPEHIIAMEHRLDEAEAAIQRVREQLHKPWKYDCPCCERIWEILDGEQ